MDRTRNSITAQQRTEIENNLYETLESLGLSYFAIEMIDDVLKTDKTITIKCEIPLGNVYNVGFSFTETLQSKFNEYIVKEIHNSKYVTKLKKIYESEIKKLKSKVKELEAYKTHYDLQYQLLNGKEHHEMVLKKNS